MSKGLKNYSQFKISDVSSLLNISVKEGVDLFARVQTVKPSLLLEEILKIDVPLAVAQNTGKARSELIVAPILVDLVRHMDHQVSFFSGYPFSVDPQKGLKGECDFLISRSKQQFFIEAPIMAIVEAKKQDIPLGHGQCLAEMAAAKRFNEQKNQPIKTIYGAVTTGDRWQFLTLEGQMAYIDSREYYIKDYLEKIFGILVDMVK